MAPPHLGLKLVGPVQWHYSDVIMGTIEYQITSLTIVYSAVYWGADQRKHQSSASLAFMRGTHRGPVNSPHKWPVTRKMFPFDDVIMRHICITRPHSSPSQHWLKDWLTIVFQLEQLNYAWMNYFVGAPVAKRLAKTASGLGMDKWLYHLKHGSVIASE